MKNIYGPEHLHVKHQGTTTGKKSQGHNKGHITFKIDQGHCGLK